MSTLDLDEESVIIQETVEEREREDGKIKRERERERLNVEIVLTKVR